MAFINNDSGDVVLCVVTVSPATANFGSNQLFGTLPAGVAAFLPLNSSSWSSTCITNASSPLSYCGMAEAVPLLDLYVSTSGANWVVNSNWLLAGSNPCGWAGVTCGGSSGPVTYVVSCSE